MYAITEEERHDLWNFLPNFQGTLYHSTQEHSIEAMHVYGLGVKVYGHIKMVLGILDSEDLFGKNHFRG